MARPDASLLLRMSSDRKERLAAAADAHQLSMTDLLLRFVDWLDTLEPGELFVTARVVTPPTTRQTDPAPDPAPAPAPAGPRRYGRNIPRDDVRAMLREAGIVAGPPPVHIDGQTEIPTGEEPTP